MALLHHLEIRLGRVSGAGSAFVISGHLAVADPLRLRSPRGREGVTG